ncbi:ester cyclase [Streptomyces sp. 35G-GA-8]|uniref:ester cyclase n=1 Tax=Streptomyces sp. 35G-GA-8 TaxID=2939434 RepID=UPI00201F8780|nr:ester cyclase [Streptomyces sp. 35G-GA-8]MCL7377055.1 ester cyclase [Streptomyces sp. 35G-GA-8]
METDAAHVAEKLFRILEAGDARLAAEVVSEDFRNREAAVGPSACSRPGPAGVLASGAWMRTAFSKLRFPITETACNDRQVWVRLRMQGRHTGTFVRFRDGSPDQAIPPTGREIDFEQIHVLDLRDGKVVRHEAVRDDIAMLGQLGVFPPAPVTALRMIAWKVTGRAARAAARVTTQAAEAAAVVERGR